jgi:hypothetical protein
MFYESHFFRKEGEGRARFLLLTFLLTILVLLITAVTVGSANAAQREIVRHSASDPDLNFNILIGSRTLSDPSWKEEQELVAGFDIDIKSNNLPLNWFLGLHSSRASKLVGEGKYAERAYAITEFNVGARKYIKITYRTRLYGGGGLAVVNSDGSYIDPEPPGDVVSEREYGFGYYVNGGGDLRLGKSFHVGADVKVSAGTEMSSGTDVDDTDTALIIGWGF